jgi:RNA polymerase sigma-70 factor (ECF subfamily)
MERAEERRLIELAAEGDQDAASGIIRHHQQSLYAYMLRMSGRPDVAEDIVQDAFVRVLTHLERFDPRYRFSTWLFTIAKRLYVNACQKHKPRYDSEIVSSWKGDGEHVAANTAIGDEVRSNIQVALQESLESLTDVQKEVVLLFHQQGWSIALIADYLDMPEGTVKSHLHRGRKRLRTLIESRQDDAVNSLDLQEANR